MLPVDVPDERTCFSVHIGLSHVIAQACYILPMNNDEMKEAALRVLLDLAMKVQTGEAIVEGVDMTQEFVHVHNVKTEQREFFGTLSTKVQLIYRVPKRQLEEEARFDQYMKDHPDSQIWSKGS